MRAFKRVLTRWSQCPHNFQWLRPKWSKRYKHPMVTYKATISILLTSEAVTIWRETVRVQSLRSGPRSSACNITGGNQSSMTWKLVLSATSKETRWERLTIRCPRGDKTEVLWFQTSTYPWKSVLLRLDRRGIRNGCAAIRWSLASLWTTKQVLRRENGVALCSIMRVLSQISSNKLWIIGQAPLQQLVIVAFKTRSISLSVNLTTKQKSIYQLRTKRPSAESFTLEMKPKIQATK